MSRKCPECDGYHDCSGAWRDCLEYWKNLCLKTEAENARLAAALLRLNGHEVIVGYERRFNTPYYQRWTKHTPLENDCSAIAWETVRELIVTPEKALRDFLSPTIELLDDYIECRVGECEFVGKARLELARLRGLVERKG